MLWRQSRWPKNINTPKKGKYNLALPAVPSEPLSTSSIRGLVAALSWRWKGPHGSVLGHWVTLQTWHNENRLTHRSTGDRCQLSSLGDFVCDWHQLCCHDNREIPIVKRLDPVHIKTTGSIHVVYSLWHPNSCLNKNLEIGQHRWQKFSHSLRFQNTIIILTSLNE